MQALTSIGGSLLVHNPLATELNSTTERLQELQQRRAALISDLEWQREFDRSSTAQAVETHQATCTALEEEMAEVARKLAAGKKQDNKLRRKTKLGKNPTYWFSAERNTAKKQRAKLHRNLLKLDERKMELTGRLTQTRKQLRTAVRTLTRFDQFSVEMTEAEIVAIDTDLPLLQLERDTLAERKQTLDRLLEEPVETLEALQDDQGRVERERSGLLSQVGEFERDIDRASRFERDLNQAANSYERAKIHEECEDRLGDGRPRAVLADRRRKLTAVKRDIATKDRQLDGIRRNLAKTNGRIAKVVDRGTRDVRALIIDGSNLCYQGGKFIRLAALRPLCDRLKDAYDITLVFDASIRRKLGGITDGALRDAFPHVTVHVVATKTKADETILAAAADPFVFVLSNDRFSEYQEKPVVRDGRLIRHEIINGQVLIHDLDVSVPFAAKD